MKNLTLLTLILLLNFATANADCISGAKNKTEFKLRFNTGDILLTGGIGDDIYVTTYSLISPNSSLSVVEDSFCSFDNNAIRVDGRLISITSVFYFNLSASNAQGNYIRLQSSYNTLVESYNLSLKRIK